MFKKSQIIEDTLYKNYFIIDNKGGFDEWTISN